MQTRRCAVVLSLIFLLPASLAAAGWEHLGAVTGVEVSPNGIELRAGKARVRISAIADSVIRVRVAPEGNFPPDLSWAVVPQTGPAPQVKIEQSRESIELIAPRVRVRIRKSPLLITFLDGEGRAIVQDDPQRPMGWNTGEVRVWKVMPADEHYYGLGEKAGPLDRRNQHYTMWNTDAFGWQESTDPLYKSIPFFIGLRAGAAYGIFFDNTYRSSFDFGKESEDFYSFGAVGGELNYYFFFGPHPKRVIEDYTALTGRTPLAPRWTLGYQQCRYSYYPEARVREIAHLFREKRIPADVLYLDIDYQDGNRPFTVDRKRFPNFDGMITDLAKQGFKLIAITDLHIKKEVGYKPYDLGIAGDHFVKNPDGSIYVGKVWPGESVFAEFTLARSREFWGSLYKEFVEKGIRGFWNDMNEPAIFFRADRTMPLDTAHRLEDGTKTDHRAIHNVFGMLNARATYEGLQRIQPDVRPFVLTRAAYAGAQRYAATWTGDNTSSWNHYRLTIPTLLGLGLSGYGFVGNDVGGFDRSPTPELLTRWHQVGVFTPIYRNHTTKGTLDQEPWVHGPEHEAIRRRYIELRYRLLPYIYTVMEEHSRTGIPAMRPIFLEYPQEDRYYTEERQFLFGRDLLVAPKTVEMLDDYEVSLPPGEWYDYWTGKKIRAAPRVVAPDSPEWTQTPGPAVLKLNPRLEELPVFVRGGAIIPQQSVVQQTDEVPDGPLQLRVYPGKDCAGSLYYDDGKSFGYTRGEFLRVNYLCAPAADSLAISISGHQGNYAPWWKQVRLEVHGIEKAPKEIHAGATVVTGWNHYAESGKVTFTLPDSKAGWEIRIVY